MAKREKPVERKTAPDGVPTAPRPVDANGYHLDGWGLPLSGPARKRRLAELERPDPNQDPDAWPVDATPTPLPITGNDPAQQTQDA